MRLQAVDHGFDDEGEVRQLLAGGALEYLALLTGYRALLLVVALLYLVAWLLATRVRRLSDVELQQGEADTAWATVPGEAAAA